MTNTQGGRLEAVEAAITLASKAEDIGWLSFVLGGGGEGGGRERGGDYGINYREGNETVRANYHTKGNGRLHSISNPRRFVYAIIYNYCLSRANTTLEFLTTLVRTWGTTTALWRPKVNEGGQRYGPGSLVNAFFRIFFCGLPCDMRQKPGILPRPFGLVPFT